MKLILKTAGLVLASGEVLWRAVGCETCRGTGYHGRAAIFELLVVDETIRNLIHPNVNSTTIDAAARRAGMVTMIETGFARCKEGVTTVEEIARVAVVD